VAGLEEEFGRRLDGGSSRSTMCGLIVRQTETRRWHVRIEFGFMGYYGVGDEGTGCHSG
jgi:hypothetical protein